MWLTFSKLACFPNMLAGKNICDLATLNEAERVGWERERCRLLHLFLKEETAPGQVHALHSFATAAAAAVNTKRAHAHPTAG